MKFEVSERLRTNATQHEVLTGLEEQFKKVSESVQRHGNSLEAKSIEASFGSINRSDTTTVDIRGVDDGFLLVANVNYRPSVAFWIILIITLWTWVFWLIPIVFYLLQKKTVQNGIQEVFTRIKNEFMTSTENRPRRQESSDLDQLQKLAQLRDNGVLTEEEFQVKKAQLLGLPPALPTEPRASAVQPMSPPQQPSPPNLDNRTVACPHCGKDILLRTVKVGNNTCPHCQQEFEAE